VNSFKRQLQYYDFKNFGDNLFSHPCFVRGQRHLCGQIIHQLPTKSQKAGGRYSVRPPRARGRKKKVSPSTSAPSSSVAGGDDASAVSSLGTESLLKDVQADVTYRDQNSQDSVTKARNTISQEHQPCPSTCKASAQRGNTVPISTAQAVNCILHQHHQQQNRALAQFQQMQAMQTATQQYLFALVQQEQMFTRSMLPNSNALFPPLIPSGHGLLLGHDSVRQFQFPPQPDASTAPNSIAKRK